MAHLRCDFFSDVLGLSTSMTVVLPQATAAQIGMTGTAPAGAPPVLYLLHGLSDDDTTWMRRTSVERYAAPLGVAVVMPQVHRSFYLDGVHTGSYWTFISQELPDIVGRFFRVSTRREDTFVAGLSMGGYGAFRLALHRPERFAAAASLSGVLDLPSLQIRSDRERLMTAIFDGRDATGTDDDLIASLDGVDPASLPPLYVACGTEDPLITGNRTFVDAAAARGIGVTTSFGPGEHTWELWDAAIQDVLAWLPLRPRDRATPGRSSP